MKKKVLLLTLFFLPIIVKSQIKVVESSNSNVSLIGKISHTAAYQTHGLSRKLPTIDPLKISGDPSTNYYIDKLGKNSIRKKANNTYKSVGIRKMSFALEEFSATMLHFKDLNKYLLTFKNYQYNYQNESFWLSEQTKEELHELLKSELEKKIKFKNLEVILDSNVVMVISINKKKVSLNVWDGYTWIQSYWYRKFKINNLFGGA
tara:strand:+ start:2158 stop:2772 length:615 start_codon:yes stop_codon:yes gene_type:complete